MGKPKITLSLKDIELSRSRARIAKALSSAESELLPAIHVYEQKVGHIKAHTLRSSDAELIRRLTQMASNDIKTLLLELSHFADQNDLYFYPQGFQLSLPWGESKERLYTLHVKRKARKHADSDVQSIITLTPV